MLETPSHSRKINSANWAHIAYEIRDCSPPQTRRTSEYAALLGSLHHLNPNALDLGRSVTTNGGRYGALGTICYFPRAAIKSPHSAEMSVEKGAKIFKTKCESCHTVEAVSAQGIRACGRVYRQRQARNAASSRHAIVRRAVFACLDGLPDDLHAALGSVRIDIAAGGV